MHANGKKISIYLHKLKLNIYIYIYLEFSISITLVSDEFFRPFLDDFWSIDRSNGHCVLIGIEY